LAEIKLTAPDNLELFRSSATEWLCDPYSVDISYTAVKDEGVNVILSCSINLWPIKPTKNSNFNLVAENFLAGRESISDIPLKELKKIIEQLEMGLLVINKQPFKLNGTGGFRYYSRMAANDRWFCDAHLAITGDQRTPLSNFAISRINNSLRLNKRPFDGLEDLASFLDLQIPFHPDSQPKIEINISPPIDVITDESNLSKGSLTLVLHAHPQFNRGTANIAIQSFPASPKDRKQLASLITWSIGEDGRQIGNLKIATENSFAVKIILMAGSNMVRRQFFEDFKKLPNRRLVSISHFDTDLKRLKQALLSKDSTEFEIAVNCLAYMLGLSGSVINETNAPDIILSTPEDNLVVIECTTKIADFHSKLGKLVDRKNSLAKELVISGDSRKVYGYLVCGLPKDQIAVADFELATNKVTLLSKESLEKLLTQLKFPQNIEKLLQQDELVIENLLNQLTTP
jgi:hypothetical protein